MWARGPARVGERVNAGESAGVTILESHHSLAHASCKRVRKEVQGRKRKVRLNWCADRGVQICLAIEHEEVAPRGRPAKKEMGTENNPPLKLLECQCASARASRPARDTPPTQ